MHKRKFVITLAVIIIVVIMILLASIALKRVRKRGGYIEIEDVSYPEKALLGSVWFERELIWSLNSYCNKHGRYPEDLYSPDFRLEILTDVNYTSDGNSVELVWKYSSHPYEDTKYTIKVIVRAQKGEFGYSKRTYTNKK